MLRRKVKKYLPCRVSSGLLFKNARSAASCVFERRKRAEAGSKQVILVYGSRCLDSDEAKTSISLALFNLSLAKETNSAVKST